MPEEKARECPSCGASNSLVADFCRQCGKMLHASDGIPPVQNGAIARADQPEVAGGPCNPTQKPWSAAAIAGFVLSFLGCVVVTALLGLVLGIIGIMKTKDGRRRGLGLAVAAIPISLVTGFIGLSAIPLVVITTRLGPSIAQLQNALRGTETAATIGAIRESCTDSFNRAVSDQALEEWLEQIRSKHGKLVKWEQASTPPTRDGDAVRFSTQSKFVNGTASITIELIQRGLIDVKVNDFAVDGVSPRDME